jgi:Protein of unknown function (DUF2905)
MCNAAIGPKARLHVSKLPCRSTRHRNHGEQAIQRVLIAIGVTLVVAGALWPWLARVPWGRLPGDISIDRGNFHFYLPLGTSLVVSVVVSLLLWWLRK